MYTILINENNTMSATEKQRIVQRSKLVDDFRFMVLPTYNGRTMRDATVLLEYLTPVSHEYKTEILTLAEDMYKEYLVYNLPVDTEFTKEAGALQIQLTFISLEMDEQGNTTQRVRKIAPRLEIDIIPITAWSDIVPDSALSAIDQRLIVQEAQLRAINELANTFDMTKADNITYDPDTNKLQLMAGGQLIGQEVSLDDLEDEIDEDGVPVVNFSTGTNSDHAEDEYDNVIKF